MRTSTLPAAGVLLFMMASRAASAAINAPSDLRVSGTSVSSVSLFWTDNSSNEDGFRIYRSTDGSSFTEVGTISFLSTYTDNTASEGVFYYYYVTSYNASEESTPSNTVTATALDPYVKLLAPNGGQALTIGSTYNVTWATNYPSLDPRMYLSTDGGATWPHTIQPSWGNNGSPFPWKVGYKDVGGDPLNPVWEQVVSSTETQCKIWITDYDGNADTDESDAVFTIEPSWWSCGSGSGLVVVVLLLAAARRRRRGL